MGTEDSKPESCRGSAPSGRKTAPTGPMDRTVLANERTFAGWLRNGTGFGRDRAGVQTPCSASLTPRGFPRRLATPVHHGRGGSFSDLPSTRPYPSMNGWIVSEVKPDQGHLYPVYRGDHGRWAVSRLPSGSGS